MTTSWFDVNAERDYWNQRYATRELIWTAEANRFVAEEVSTLNPGRALDLAAGEGRNTVWLAERDWQVRAVDLSDVAIGKARQLATSRNVADRIDFQATDLRDFEPEAASFDLVMLIYLQLPQAELQPIIARAANAVAPGGTFLLVAHDASNIEHGYGGPQDPAVLHSAAQVTPLLDGRFDIERAGVAERPVKTDSGVQIALDCVVRGSRHD
jgi:2-polyprenyl-3-methyl-5-hydroxy-6-metoxy-1,4-benzoquinol methylase